jgi:peptide/nickel transport system permease protein
MPRRHTTSQVAVVGAVAGAGPRRGRQLLHPMRKLIIQRCIYGLFTLLAVAVVVFAATQVLPGNAAYAVLGKVSADPARLHQLERQMGLNRPILTQFWIWFKGILTGHFGTSLANGEPVWSLVGPCIANSAVLVVLSGVIGSVLGVVLGVVTAIRRDGILDHIMAVIALTISALPEFVVALILIFLVSTNVFHIVPAVSLIQPGTSAWAQPRLLILPVATLVIVIFPYIARMVRGAMIEALESEYVEMARLRGLKPWRVLLVHALPNATAPGIQVIGLNFLYLAGGIVVVEYVYNYPGIGFALVNAVTNRDVPTIQFIVVMLAAFYVVMNVFTDVVALMCTPRRRVAR